MESNADIVARIHASKKYRNLCSAVIERAVAETHPGNTDPVKAVKERLHQVYGAYINPSLHKKASRIIAAMGDDIRATALTLLALHVSTAERLLSYESMYRSIFETTGPARSVIDIAAGFNPFSMPLMPAQPEHYLAVDIDEAFTGMINTFFTNARLHGIARTGDALSTPPHDEADVAFIFKFIPLINDADAALRLLRALRVKYIAVSFPLKSIGGRSKGMFAHYSKMFYTMVENNFSVIKELTMPNELLFIIIRK
ncbi:MAG: hypothetical protein HZC28_15860 [Spirochaetes bacterium]|nr:hypothetical protein [Spirochaetota bacterium]